MRPELVSFQSLVGDHLFFLISDCCLFKFVNTNIRRRAMMTFEEKLKCCSSVATRMLFATLEAIKERSTCGYEQMTWYNLVWSYLNMEDLFSPQYTVVKLHFADSDGVLWWWKCCWLDEYYWRTVRWVSNSLHL